MIDWYSPTPSPGDYISYVRGILSKGGGVDAYAWGNLST